MRRSGIRWLTPLYLVGLLWAGTSQYQAVKHKIDALGTPRVPPGSRVVLTDSELNSYIAGEIPQVVGPGAVTSFRLQLGEGSAVVHTRIDFLRLQRNTGRNPGWLMQKMLEGERDVEAAAHFRSSNGHGTVWVDRVEVAGIPISGALLDFLMEVFIQPQFPNVKLGEPFPLRPGVERFEVHPQAVHVFATR